VSRRLAETRSPDVTPLDPAGPYRRWAAILFTVLVLVVIVGLVALSATPGPAVIWVALASVIPFMATLVVVVAALRRQDAWAVHAIAPICYLIVAAAAIRLLVALSESTITLPLDGIGALMVLTREPGPERLPAIADQGRWRVWLAVGAVLVAQVVPFAQGPIASGGPFGAQRGSLDLQVAIDCAVAVEPGGEIPVRAAWSWGGGEIFSPPTDGLVVLWNMTTSGDGDSGDTGAGATVRATG
jgi:hypothetical protein